MDEIAQALVAKHASIPPELHDRIRLFDARQHRDYREFQPSQALSTAGLETSYSTQFYAEPVPLEEEEAGDLDRAILVLHFQKDFGRLHGVPVKFVVKPVCPPDPRKASLEGLRGVSLFFFFSFFLFHFLFC